MTSPLPVLTPLRLSQGVWEAALTDLPNPDDPPALMLHCGDERLEPPHLERFSDGGWLVRVEVPPRCLSDGMQVFVLSLEETREKLGSFAILAGDAFNENLRAEMQLLRAELDMLKRAFRRHCRET